MSKRTEQFNSKIIIPELLAPAGTKEAFIAAVEAGADAVYLGGNLFNARMSAGNFDDDEMAEAIAFAHKRGVKVHVTVNTLIRDDELTEALKHCENIYAAGADALIVQDLGLAYLINGNLPGMELHLSTQGTVYDLAGVKAAAKLGFDRVVLARELSLGQIKEITEGIRREDIRPMAVEVFCHGAICMCYSGQCQLSRYIGGRSGNRGECAQPCRLPYKTSGNINNVESCIDTTKGDLIEGYPLSPSDLSLIDHLGELAEAGVKSIKIEGRMKSPEYVGVVTSIYRKYLDELRDHGTYRVTPEDRLELTQIFNRGFTDHHFRSEEDRNYLSGELPKNRGVQVSEVISGSKGNPLITIRLTGDLQMGDGIEIRGGDRRATALVTYLKTDAGKETAIIGDVKEEVRPGDKVYRISSKEQLKNAASYYKDKDWHQGKYIRKLPIVITISQDHGILHFAAKRPEACGYGECAVSLDAGPFNEFKGSIRNEDKRNIGSVSHSINDRLKTAMNKTGGTPFAVKELNIDEDIQLDISMAELNSIRRELLKKLEAALEGRRKRPDIDWEKIVSEVNRDGDEANDMPALELYFYSVKDCEKFFAENSLSDLVEESHKKGVAIRVLLPFDELKEQSLGELIEIDAAAIGEIEIVPYLDAVGAADAIDAADDEGTLDVSATAYKLNPSFIYTGSIGAIETAKNNGLIPLYDYGMNIYNKAGAAAMRSLGALKGMPSLEENDVYFGAVPLMIMEHIPEEDYLIDRKGAGYHVLKRDNHKTMLIPQVSEKADYKSLIKRAKTKPTRVFISEMV